MNIKVITDIQRQLDVLSDGHQNVVDQAVRATGAISNLDDRIEKYGSNSGVGLYTRQVAEQLGLLDDQFAIQEARIKRVRAEIAESRKNLKIA